METDDIKRSRIMKAEIKSSYEKSEKNKQTGKLKGKKVYPVDSNDSTITPLSKKIISDR